MIKVTVTVDFGIAERRQLEKSFMLSEQSTVLDALRSAAPIVTSRRYAMDHFVEEIDGVKNDFVGDRGWQFEVNGLSSNVPAERYLVKNGDWIKWRYLVGSCS